MEPHRTGRNDPQTPTLEPGRALGAYLVLSTLSASAHSTIYMAQDLALDRPVALKTSPRGAVSVIAEGRVLARLNHPHIVTLHGLWAQPPALILEYLVGETLKTRRERLGPLPESHVQNWMTAVLSALEWVHGQGLAHGALRSENIFLTTDQRIKILDFRQTSLGESPPMPADDVRAAGRLMQDLLQVADGWLAEIARSAVLGRYPTARALRLALSETSAEAIIETSETQDLILAGASLALTISADVTPEQEQALSLLPAPAADVPPAQGGSDIHAARIDSFEEPSINPMLPVFHDRPGWGRQVAGRKRLGVLLTLLLASGILAVHAGWPHRREALRPVSRIAHAVVQLTHEPVHLPKGGTTEALSHKPNVRPGAYAALAHAWGG